MGRFSLAVLLGVAFVLSGCGDVHHALRTADDIKEETKHLSKRTDDLERSLVNKEANTTLSDFLDLLYGEGKFSNQNPTEPTLIEEAGFAVEAMHFQYWKGDYNEPVSVLDDFFSQSLEILFVHTSGHIPRDFSIDVMMPDREWKAVGALAFQLGRMRPEYEANLRLAGLKDLSVYDVIVQALKNRDVFARKERLPKTAAVVLQWKQEAIYLLQMRQAFTPLTVLARLTDFQDKKDIGWKIWNTRAWDALFGGSLTIDLATQDPTRKVDPEQYKLYTSWLNQALQTREELRAMCIEPQANKMIGRILSGTKVLLPTTKESSLFAPGLESQVRGAFAAAFARVTGADGSEKAKKLAPECAGAR